jgi:hypothetical protein
MDREIWSREGGKLRAQFDANKALAEDSGCVECVCACVCAEEGARRWLQMPPWACRQQVGPPCSK